MYALCEATPFRGCWVVYVPTVEGQQLDLFRPAKWCVKLFHPIDRDRFVWAPLSDREAALAQTEVK